MQEDTGPVRDPSIDKPLSGGFVMAITIVVIFIGMVAATIALAQPMCAPWKDLRPEFKRAHKEEPVAAGVSRGSMVVVLATEDGKTFTVFLVHPNGLACAIAAGTDWQAKQDRGF